MKIAVLFPGQGSQYIGMGKNFVETNSRCAAIMEQAESVCDVPIRTLSFEGPLEQLTRAAVVQPALSDSAQHWYFDAKHHESVG